MKKLSFSLITLLLLMSSAFASEGEGGHVGNGGGGIYCSDTDTLYPADTFEMERKKVRLLPLDQMSRNEIFETIRNRLLSLENSKKGAEYEVGVSVAILPQLETYYQHLSDSSLWQNADLSKVNTDDSHWSNDRLPPFCSYQQVARLNLPAGQSIPIPSFNVSAKGVGELKIQIDRSASEWPRLTALHQRVFELHEAFYAMGFFYMHHWSSTQTQHLVAELLREKVNFKDLLKAFIDWDSQKYFLSNDYFIHQQMQGVYNLRLGERPCPQQVVIESTGRSAYSFFWVDENFKNVTSLLVDPSLNSAHVKSKIDGNMNSETRVTHLMASYKKTDIGFEMNASSDFNDLDDSRFLEMKIKNKDTGSLSCSYQFSIDESKNLLRQTISNFYRATQLGK